MNIYSSQKALPYVYKCTEIGTGRFYIGYRFKNTLPSTEDFGKHYFTSNEYVKNNFGNFEWEIIAEFFDRKSAFAFETQLIKETKSDKQINLDKHEKTKTKYGKAKINESCLLPGCEKYINSSIKRFCCKVHSAQYAARKKHGTLYKSPKTLEQIKEYQRQYYLKKKGKCAKFLPGEYIFDAEIL